MLRRPPICGSLRLRTTAQEYVLEGDGSDSGTALRLQRSQTDEVIVTQLPPMSGYGELGESVGLEWAGRWKRPKTEGPHYQLAGLQLDRLIAMQSGTAN